MHTVTGIGPYSEDPERVRQKCLALSDGQWEGSSIKTLPVVKKKVKSGGRTVDEKSVDKMLKELDRKVRKSGVLEEFQERQHFTPPSKERREARREAEYRAKKNQRKDPMSGS